MNSFHLLNEGFCFSLGFWFLLDRVSFCSSGWSGTDEAGQASFKLMRSDCLYLPNGEIKGVHHTDQFNKGLVGCWLFGLFFNVATEGIYSSPFQLDRVD